jgi:hypothetical protein
LSLIGIPPVFCVDSAGKIKDRKQKEYSNIMQIKQSFLLKLRGILKDGRLSCFESSFTEKPGRRRRFKTGKLRSFADHYSGGEIPFYLLRIPTLTSTGRMGWAKYAKMIFKPSSFVEPA